MTTIGIDIGGRMHVAARCRDGQTRADREILRVSQDRAGFTALDAWLERQPEPGDAGDDGVVGPLLDAARLAPAPARHPGRGGEPARGEVLCEEPARPDEVRPGRCPEPRRDGHARHARRPRPAGRRRAAPGGPLRDDPGRPSRRRSASASSGWSSSASPSSASCSTTPTCRTAREVLRIAPTARAATRRRTSTLANANGSPGHRRLGTDEGRAPPGRRRPTRSRCPSSTPRSLSRSASCSTSTTCSSARSPTPTSGSRASSTARSPAGSRRSRASGPRSPRPCSPRSATSRRFDDFDQLLAYAGVHPAERSSGKKGSNPETSWHMSKAGNSHLRAAAYRMAIVGVQHNPVIAAHYARKRAAGKSKMNALGHCMRKALGHRLGRLAKRSGLRPRLGDRGLTGPYGI